MKVLEIGHVYELVTFDSQPGEKVAPAVLTFANRKKGNEKRAGTNVQEVLRALIDRTQHCEQGRHWEGNNGIIHHLRMALALQEADALICKAAEKLYWPEQIKTDTDGHFSLRDI